MKKSKNFYIIDILMIISLIFLIFTRTSKQLIQPDLLTMSFLGYVICYFAIFLNNKKENSFILFLPLIVVSIIDMFFIHGIDLFNNNEILKDILSYLEKNYSLLLIILVFFIIDRVFVKLIGRYFLIALGTIALIVSLCMQIFEKPAFLVDYSEILKLFFLYTLFSNMNIKNVDKSKYRIGLFLSVFLLIAEVFMAKKYFFYKLDLPFSMILIYYFVFKLICSNVDKIGLSKYYFMSLLYLFPMVSNILFRFDIISTMKNKIATFIVLFFLSIIFEQLHIFILDYMFFGVHKKKR